MKNAIVLPGGGFRGSVQVGALKAFIEAKKPIDLITSTSVGTLNGAFMAMEEYDHLFEQWDEVGRNNASIITKSYIGELKDGGVKINLSKVLDIAKDGIDAWDIVRLVGKKGRDSAKKRIVRNLSEVTSIMDNSPLIEHLEKYVKASKFKKPLYFTLVSLYDGKLYKLRHDSFMTDHDLCLALAASSTIPLLWKPIDKIQLKDGSFIYSAVDGGLRLNSPISLAYANIDRIDPWSVWVFNCNSLNQLPNKSPKTLFAQIGLSVEILMNEGINRDVKTSIEYNDWAFKYPDWAAGENKIYARLHNIEAPTDWFGKNLLGPTMDPSAQQIQRRIQLGFDTTRQRISLVA